MQGNIKQIYLHTDLNNRLLFKFSKLAKEYFGSPSADGAI